jgi:S-adenosylmethionine-diacylglycerol 3-amino-3-carboxypropyl transferase
VPIAKPNAFRKGGVTPPSSDSHTAAKILRQGTDLRALTNAARKATRNGLEAAVHRHRPASRAGLSERLFTLAFRGLVYPQIWEDPVVDIDALALEPTSRVVAIASGGCNALSYLAAGAADVVAIDLNGAHVALGELKKAAIRKLDYAGFRRFFVEAASDENIWDYDARLRGELDAPSRAYWESRDRLGRRRIRVFARNFYRYGLLGHFIRAAHMLVRANGADPAHVLSARTLDEQRAIFERDLAPIFDKPLIRWIVNRPSSLFGLGIPPAQYKALAADSEEGIVGALRSRVERLACDYPVADNYFAWQAFGGRYDARAGGSLPPYLQEPSFDTLKARVDAIRFVHGSLTQWLADSPAASLDRYVLLDAQDWMGDADLTALWYEITRTARRGARVIFRTAADERLLPGRIPDAILREWRYDEEASRAGLARDRSAIYGGFHLYVKAA